MAHLRRYSTPPPMSPATASAHNFYGSFAGAPPRQDSPPVSYSQPPPPPRPTSAAQQKQNPQFYPGAGQYVNAQYYSHGHPSGLGLSGFGGSGGGGGGGGGSSHSGSGVGGRKGGPRSPPPLQTSFANMTMHSDDGYGGYPQVHSPPPHPGTAPPPLTSNRSHYGPPYTGRPHTPGNNSSNGRDPRPAPPERMPGAFPDDNGSGPRQQQQQQQQPPPVIGVKAAAAQRAREQAEAASNQGDSYWGYLFDHESNPPAAKDLLSNFLRGVANYIISDFEPKESLVITPPKMKAFYTKFKAVNGEPLNWDNFFLGRPVKGLSEIYQALNCHHHLVPPKDSAGSAPTVPGLTPRGFERWMLVQILSDPDREARRLIAVLKQCPIQNPQEKDAMMKRFPKTLTRDAFPKYPDSDMKGLWDLFVPDDEPRARSVSRPRTKSRDRTKSYDEDHERDRDRERDLERREIERRERDQQEQIDREKREREQAREQAQIESQREAEMRYREAFPGSPEPDLRKYENMPPPPVPGPSGIERQRQPYSRTPQTRKEDVAEVESDDEYTGAGDKLTPTAAAPERRVRRSNGTGEIELYPSNSNSKVPKRRNTRGHSHSHSHSHHHMSHSRGPHHEQYPPSSPSDTVDPRKDSELDLEEEDLYAVMASKKAEIQQIERRLAGQSNSSMSQAMVHSPRDSGPPQQQHMPVLDPEEEEAMERARRADQDWEREAREREKWVEAGRQKYHRDLSRDPASEPRSSYLQGDYTVETPVSNYSWRDSFGGAPAGPGGKRMPLPGGPGGRLSGGGEWEEFKYDDMSPPRGRRQSIGDRLYSEGHRPDSHRLGVPPTGYGYNCGCNGYEHAECGAGR